MVVSMSLAYGLFAQDTRPTRTVQIKGSAEDFFIDGKLLYVAGDHGTLFCIEIASKKIIKSLTLSDISDFMGNPIRPKILCIDKNPFSGEILLVSQGKSGYRNVFIVDNWTERNIIQDIESKLMIVESRFVKPSHIVIATLSNEIILYNYADNSFVYQKQIGYSTLSDISLDEQRSKIAVADESGTITILDPDNGNVINQFTSEHVDKVNKVCYYNNIVVGGGQDRRLSFYNTESKKCSHIESEFLIYSLGMSPDNRYIIFNEDESNALTLYNRISKLKLTRLVGHKGIVTNSLFDGKWLVTSGEDGKICWWDLCKFY